MPSRRPARARAGAPVAVLVVAVAAATGGCGAQPAPTRSGPDPVATGCRQQWTALEADARRRAQQRGLSAQPDRWDSLAAGARYFATRARPADCETPLAEQRDRVQALSTYSRKLAAWDLPHQLETVAPKIRHYHGKKPSRRAVRHALALLRREAPRAMADLRPAWQQAATVDISDPAQQRNALAGLKLLAGDSVAFGRCRQALRTLHAALRSAER